MRFTLFGYTFEYRKERGTAEALRRDAMHDNTWEEVNLDDEDDPGQRDDAS